MKRSGLHSLEVPALKVMAEAELTYWDGHSNTAIGALEGAVSVLRWGRKYPEVTLLV